MKSTPRSNLIVAPYPGEFGWELMNWQARVRQTAHEGDYDRVTIVGPPDRRALYGDLLKSQPNRVRFCPSRPLDLPGHPSDDHRVDDAGTRIDRDMLAARLERFTRLACRQAGFGDDGTILMPAMDSTIYPTMLPSQRFVSFHRAGPIDIDIALVSRKRSIAPERNQPDSWWSELQTRLRVCGLVVVACDPPLTAAISTLSRSRLAIGASTGGLHLASLCDCPHYVWGPGAESVWTPIRMTNRQRYETIWNPFGTACHYDECGWQPSIDHVVRRALSALRRIGLRRNATSRPRRAGTRWLIRRKLSSLLTASPRGSAVPWRVREFVRERLI